MTFAILKCITDDSLDALAGIDIFLRCNFVRSSLFEDATGIGVDPFGVFAKDHEIYIFGLDSFQWTQRGIEQAHGPHVRVQIHLEAHAQQNFLGMDVGLHARIAERSDQDGVEVAAQHGEPVRRHRDLIAQIAIGAPIEMGQAPLERRRPESP